MQGCGWLGAYEKGASRVEMEDSRLGFNFTDAGAELANRWKFPEPIVDGIRHQLNPQVSEDEYKPMAGIVYIAKYIYDNQASSEETLIADFPLEHGKQAKVDMVSVFANISELHELESGIEELLDS